ncbi:unnamed protein product [Caenorhabditis angaria]|uniref:CCHC-type domain-containing protein n=1 Tax=Caenorhabditis angaria TaxID=860376 RepID=A0A9P1NB50_9PELO|nr:unnamed protein product [Caenorhabditis angaria]
MPSDSESQHSAGNHVDLIEVNSDDTYMNASEDIVALLRATISRIELELVEKEKRFQRAKEAFESQKDIARALKLMLEESVRNQASNSADQTSEAIEKGTAEERRNQLEMVARKFGIVIVPTPTLAQSSDQEKTESETALSNLRNQNSTSHSECSVTDQIFGTQTPSSSMSRQDQSNIEFARRNPPQDNNSCQNSVYMTRGMMEETERLLHKINKRRLVRSEGFINREHFLDELRTFIYGDIKQPMSYFGDGEEPARPFMTLNGEKFDIHFYPSNTYEKKIRKEHEFNGCSWCYGRNTEYHPTTRCECLHDHQKRLILLLGWRCWGCLEAGHMIDECPRFGGQFCKKCKGPNPSKSHSAWTHFHALAIFTTMEIESQEAAVYKCKVLRFEI